MRYWCLVFAFSLPILFSPTSVAQRLGSISGIVTDNENDTSLPGAHVFISNTTIGDITDANGFFNIQEVQAGSYQLIVTMVGYKSLQQPVEILSGSTTNLALKLERDVYEVGEITVTDRQPKNWKRDLNRFKRMFLGITTNRRGCDIDNPYSLDFKHNNSVFSASSSRPLTIENRSLGYRITYILNEFISNDGEFRFSGEPVFEELEPKNEKETRKWEKQRLSAYNGSFQHFLRSLAAGTSNEEGFRFFLLDHLNWRQTHSELLRYYTEAEAEVPADSILKSHPLPHERVLQFPGYLHIFYLNEMMDRDFYEWVAMHYNASKEPVRAVIRVLHVDAIFNEIGFLNNAYDVARYGYWNWESGLCNWLPFNYGLEQNP